jgi:hypothetical protein
MLFSTGILGTGTGIQLELPVGGFIAVGLSRGYLLLYTLSRGYSYTQ